LTLGVKRPACACQTARLVAEVPALQLADFGADVPEVFKRLG
jgi:hypothetical protein